MTNEQLIKNEKEYENEKIFKVYGHFLQKNIYQYSIKEISDD